MKIFLSKDEWYPVYKLSEDSTDGEEAEIDERLYRRYKYAYNCFKNIQKIIEEKFIKE